MSTPTSEVYVWAWLPGAAEPVPAGVLTPAADGLVFRYGDRYRARENAVALSPTLRSGTSRRVRPTTSECRARCATRPRTRGDAA